MDDRDVLVHYSTGRRAHTVVILLFVIDDDIWSFLLTTTPLEGGVLVTHMYSCTLMHTTVTFSTYNSWKMTHPQIVFIHHDKPSKLTHPWVTSVTDNSVKVTHTMTHLRHFPFDNDSPCRGYRECVSQLTSAYITHSLRSGLAWPYFLISTKSQPYDMCELQLIVTLY